MPTKGTARYVLASAVAVAVLTAIVLGLPAAIWFPVAWAATGMSMLVVWIIRVADPRDRDILIAAVLIGVLVRIVAATFIVDYPLRFPDTRLYWRLGTRLADMWTRPHIAEVHIIRTLGTARAGYYAWVAGHSIILRQEVLIPITNAMVDGANIIMTYVIGRHIWNARVGRNAAIFIASSSAMILVSSCNLRDALATLSGLAIAYGALQLTERWNVKGMIWFVLGLAAMLQIRVYIAALVVMVLLVALLVVRRSGRLTVLMVIGVVGAVLAVVVSTHEVVSIVSKLAKGNTVFELIKFAQRGLIGTRPTDSAVSGINLNSAGDLVIYLPLGFIRAWFGPQPWMTRGIDVLFTPDVMVRHAVLPLFFVGIWHAVRTNWRRTLLIVLLLLGEMTIYALIELGGNARHNTQYFPYHYMFVCIGWTVARRYTEALWIGYAVVSLAVVGYGMTLPIAKWLLPLLLVLLGIWWLAVVRPWNHRAAPGSL